MIGQFQKRHRVICTSRNYREVTNLAKIRKLNLIFVGKHGGSEKFDKLNASNNRINQLSKIIQKNKPDIAVSFCSPEASRVAFGLGIKHISFSDSPHAEAVMRLSIPLIQKLLIPWIIPKKEFEKLDVDKSGFITQTELFKLFLGKLTSGILKKAMKYVDTNGDGKISFQEYVVIRKQLAGFNIPTFGSKK